MKLLPLTNGLLVSMAARIDHSFGFTLPPDVKLEDLEPLDRRMIHTNESRKQLIEECRIWYNIFSNPDYKPIKYSPEHDAEHRAFEEASGNGFYQPELEEEYAVQFPK